MLLQKTTAPAQTVTVKMTFRPTAKYAGERTGLTVFGRDYAALTVENSEQGLVLSQVECRQADKGKPETVNETTTLKDSTFYLRADIRDSGEKLSKSEGGHDQRVMCQFSYSTDGRKFRPLGKPFQVREGTWIGAKHGIFCTRPHIVTNDGGWVDVDWYRVTR
mgnify:FL=1